MDKIKAFYGMLGLTSGVLLLVALSGKADGSNPTWLQVYLPFIVAIGVILVVLGVLVKIYFSAKHSQENQTRMFMQMLNSQYLESQQTHRYTISVMGQITSKQAATIDKAIENGAELRRLKSGGYAAIVEGQVIPVSEAEAKYWIEGPK